MGVRIRPRVFMVGSVAAQRCLDGGGRCRPEAGRTRLCSGWQHAGALRAAAAVSAEWGVRRRVRCRIHVWRVLEQPQRCHDLAARRRRLSAGRGCYGRQHVGALRDQGPSSGVVVPSAVSG